MGFILFSHWPLEAVDQSIKVFLREGIHLFHGSVVTLVYVNCSGYMDGYVNGWVDRLIHSTDEYSEDVYFSFKLFQYYSYGGEMRHDLIDVTAPW